MTGLPRGRKGAQAVKLRLASIRSAARSIGNGDATIRSESERLGVGYHVLRRALLKFVGGIPTVLTAEGLLNAYHGIPWGDEVTPLPRGRNGGRKSV